MVVEHRGKASPRRTSSAGASTGASFRARLWRYPGPAGWTFVTVPSRHAPSLVGPFGRTPVRARVDDGPEWETSTWRDKQHGTVLPIPKRFRGGKEHGDTVTVSIALDAHRL